MDSARQLDALLDDQLDVAILRVTRQMVAEHPAGWHYRLLRLEPMLLVGRPGDPHQESASFHDRPVEVFADSPGFRDVQRSRGVPDRLRTRHRNHPALARQPGHLQQLPRCGAAGTESPPSCWTSPATPSATPRSACRSTTRWSTNPSIPGPSPGGTSSCPSRSPSSSGRLTQLSRRKGWTSASVGPAPMWLPPDDPAISVLMPAPAPGGGHSPSTAPPESPGR